MPFTAWLGRLVHLAALDQRRGRRRLRRETGADARMISAPEAEAGDDAQLAPLRAALAALPERYRAPLSLYYFAGLDQAGVGRALGLRPGTVAARISRGVARLRARLRARLQRAMPVGAALALIARSGDLPTYAAPAHLHLALVRIATTPAAAGASAVAGTASWAKVALLTLVAAIGAVSTTLAVHAGATPRGGEALLRAVAPGRWVAAPGTAMRDVVPDPARFPALRSSSGPVAIITGWSGGALDARRGLLYVWGGGASDYSGNELYAFDVAALRWRRVTEPWPSPSDDASDANLDGTPKSRATYGGLAFLDHADRLFAAAGCVASAVAPATHTWLFDPASGRWNGRVVRDGPQRGYDAACAYDPATRLVWWCADPYPGPGGLWSYDEALDAWTRRTVDEFSGQTCVVDERRHALVVVGGGAVLRYDLGVTEPVKRVWATSGGGAIVAAHAPGLAYDPVGDRIVGWCGGPVYTLDPTTGAWTATDAPGAPTATPHGIYGRWRYVAALDAFLAVTGIDDDVRFFKPRR